MATRIPPQTVIFFGPQGAGKGTQREFVSDYLQQAGGEVLVHDSGQAFRETVESGGYAAERIQSCIAEGQLLPYVIPVIFWGQKFLRELTPDAHVLIDGSPRTQAEAQALDASFAFFKRDAVQVIHLTLSREESITRLEERSRADDQAAGIARRLDAYYEETLPLLTFFQERPERYTVSEINGAQSREDVLQDILSALEV